MIKDPPFVPLDLIRNCDVLNDYTTPSLDSLPLLSHYTIQILYTNYVIWILVNHTELLTAQSNTTAVGDFKTTRRSQATIQRFHA